MNNTQFPLIPDKRYFAIGEASDLCLVEPHILRYWESEFPALKPMKRLGNRRYYQKKDLLFIRDIHLLLYEQGFTIAGAKQKLQAKTEAVGRQDQQQAFINEIKSELQDLLRDLKKTLQ